MKNHSQNNSFLVHKLSYPISGLLAYTLILLLFIAFDGSVFAADSVGVDMLMGGQGRANHQKQGNFSQWLCQKSTHRPEPFQACIEIIQMCCVPQL